MEFSVGGQQHDPAVLPLRRDLVADPIREMFGEGVDRTMARNIPRLEPQTTLAHKTVALAFDEHGLPDAVELRVFVLPAEVPTFHHGVAEYRTRRAGRQGGGGVRLFPPIASRLRGPDT